VKVTQIKLLWYNFLWLKQENEGERERKGGRERERERERERNRERQRNKYKFYIGNYYVVLFLMCNIDVLYIYNIQ